MNSTPVIPLLAVLAVIGLVFAIVLVRHLMLPKEPPQPMPVELSGEPLYSTEAPLPQLPEPEPQIMIEPENVCCVCGEPEDPNTIETEDWQQVRSWTGSWFAFLGYRTPMEPGRRLYARRAWCRSCAAIANQLNQLWLQQEKVSAEARKRQWERAGLVDATRQAVSSEKKRYEEEQERMRRVSQMV